MKTFCKKLIILILISGCARLSFAQPAWNIDPHEYEFSMTITAKITSDGDFSENVNDRVAAFVDDVCRGVTNIIFDSTADGYYLYLMVYGNKPSETVTFKIFDAGNNEISDAKRSLVFVINGIVGSLDSPLIISSEKLNDKAELSNFTIPGQIGETLFSNRNLYLCKNPESDLSRISAKFSVSEGAKVFVNGIRQESEISINDFSKPVLYAVISADFTDTTTYTVLVSDGFTEINNVEKVNSDLIIYPNPFNEFFFIEMPQCNYEVLATIFSANGKMIKTQRLLPGTLNKIESYELNPGLYIINFKFQDDIKYKKIIKY